MSYGMACHCIRHAMSLPMPWHVMAHALAAMACAMAVVYAMVCPCRCDGMCHGMHDMAYAMMFALVSCLASTDGMVSRQEQNELDVASALLPLREACEKVVGRHQKGELRKNGKRGVTLHMASVAPRSMLALH